MKDMAWEMFRLRTPHKKVGFSDQNYVPHLIWVRAKIKPPGIGPQVLLLGSIYQGSILGAYFYPLPYGRLRFAGSIMSRSGREPSAG